MWSHRTWHIIGWTLRIAAGVVLILVGILGLLLPIMPGWLLIVPGILLVAPDTKVARWIKRQFDRFRPGKSHQPPAP